MMSITPICGSKIPVCQSQFFTKRSQKPNPIEILYDCEGCVEETDDDEVLYPGKVKYEPPAQRVFNR